MKYVLKKVQETQSGPLIHYMGDDYLWHCSPKEVMLFETVAFAETHWIAHEDNVSIVKSIYHMIDDMSAL